MKFCKVITKITELLMSFNTVIDEITDSLTNGLNFRPNIPSVFERVQEQDFLWKPNNTKGFIRASAECQMADGDLFSYNENYNLTEMFATWNMKEMWIDAYFDIRSHNILDPNGRKLVLLTHSEALTWGTKITTDKQCVMLKKFDTMQPDGSSFQLTKNACSYNKNYVCKGRIKVSKRYMEQLQDLKENALSTMHHLKQLATKQKQDIQNFMENVEDICLLYTSPSPRD